VPVTLGITTNEASQPIRTEIELVFEYSTAGQVWERRAPSAVEYARNVGELRALISTYARWVGPSAGRLEPPPPLARLVAYGGLKRRPLAVVVRRLNAHRSDYEPAAGWSLLDSPERFEVWCVSLAAELLTPGLPHVTGLHQP
jgi:hypothetical protein